MKGAFKMKKKNTFFIIFEGSKKTTVFGRGLSDVNE